MTTTREKALEAALRSLEDQSGRLRSLCVAAGVLKPSDIGHAQALENESAARAALALPPDQPAAPAPVAAGEHTPGPWHINYHGGQTTDACVWGPDGTKRGCIARVNLCGLDRDDFTARSGNARLIAAAPDMLAALQACLNPLIRLGDFIGNEHRGENGIPAFDRCAIIGQVRAAIARATGRSEG